MPRKRRQRRGVHAALFLVTFVTTTAVGVAHYLEFLAGFSPNFPPLSPSLLLGGLWYSGTILAILGCHELGHYLACRYYRIDASLPYFLPFLYPTGTVGAFIRIRQPIPTKRMYFDIGVAGPLAGFAVAVPALVLGVMLSDVARIPAQFVGYELGEPLLFKAAAWSVWGAIPKGYSINLHPMAFAAWFGLLATALNLFPIGQLDGGHISYAVLGRRSTWITCGALAAAMVLSVFHTSWVVWTGLILAMLYFFGLRHPRAVDEHVRLDAGRLVVALLAAIIFIVCFTPAPIEFIQLLPH